MSQHVPDLDWDKFYAALERLVVSIPDPGAGDLPDLPTLGRLFTKVQRNRERLDRIGTLLARRVGTLKRQVHIVQQTVRLERAHAEHSEEARAARGKRERDAIVELIAGPRAVQLAALRGRLEMYESAQRAAAIQLATLETAKQTLNALKAIALAGADLE